MLFTKRHPKIVKTISAKSTVFLFSWHYPFKLMCMTTVRPAFLSPRFGHLRFGRFYTYNRRRKYNYNWPASRGYYCTYSVHTVHPESRNNKILLWRRLDQLFSLQDLVIWDLVDFTHIIGAVRITTIIILQYSTYMYCGHRFSPDFLSRLSRSADEWQLSHRATRLGWNRVQPM